jgi:Na+-translocating ferredoxin:NAD+ oxidoreductase RnfG subunit
MQRLSFLLFSLIFIVVVMFISNGTFKHIANRSENQHKNNVMEEKIFNNQLSESEKKRQKKELKEFLKKKAKPNALLPLPNPETKLNMNGMPLPDGEKVESFKLN